jgi:hypothetical protein
MSFGRAASTRALVLVGCALCCRIYRDEPDSDEAGRSVAAPRTPVGAAEPSDDREAVAAQQPAADALNLWVLSRPKDELVPQGAEAATRAPVERAAEQPKPTVLVVLGVGEAQACAAWYGRRSVDALAEGVAPLRVVASVLESARRWRWADAESTVSGMVRSSEGAFGGVQAAPPASFTAGVLEAAAERHVLIDGRNPRATSSLSLVGRGSGPIPSIPPCAVASAPALGGPLGVLIRTARGEFFGGVISLDLPVDAGVVSMMTEYGVALSVGPRGGVLMVSDCPLLPPDRVAERVYASPNWVSSTAEPNELGSCGTGHALLTAERAWVTTGSPLSWAAAEMAAPSLTAAPAAREPRADAGANGPGSTVSP